MNSLRLYTRNVSGLDYRVWMTMLAVCLISVGLFGYQRFKSASMSVQPCKDFQFTINGKTATVANCNLGSISIFQLSAAAGAKVEWDFNDGSAIQKGSIVQHRFTKEGDYKVVATVNDHCEYNAWVTVKVLAAPEKEIPLVTMYPDSLKAMAGSQIRFSAGANFDVQNYTWTVSGTSEVKTGQTIVLSFPIAGRYEVVVTANHDSKISDRKTIEIMAFPQAPLPFPTGVPDVGNFPPFGNGTGNPKPPTPFESQENKSAKPDPQQPSAEPAGNKSVNVSEETFKELLQAVLKGEEEISRLYEYLELDETTSVCVNGSQEVISLKEFCQKKKKHKIESIKFRRNDKNEISRLDVKVKGRKIWDKIF